MVKICSKCNMKNSNKSDYCINCSSSLANAKIIEDKEFDSTIDDHYKFKSKSYKIITNVWRPFVYLGIFFAVVGLFFIGGLLFACIAILLGGIAVTRGEILGAIPIIIAVIHIILIFFI